MLASFLKQSRLLRSSQGLVQATPSLYRQLAEAARQEEDPAGENDGSMHGGLKPLAAPASGGGFSLTACCRAETSAEVIAEPAEADPNTIVAVPREASGSTASYRLRQASQHGAGASIVVCIRLSPTSTSLIKNP